VALTKYLADTQRLLHDSTNQFWSQSDLTAYINTARSQIAAEGQCVRVLAPSAGAITSATVVTQGTNYSGAPTITASGGLGSGATFTPTIVGGKITALAVATQGTNYTLPTISITDTTGTGATANAVQSGVLLTTAAQESYSFSSVNTIVSLSTGVSAILTVVSVSVSWGALKPTLDQLDWSSFQAYLRSYSAALQGQPAIWAQYGQGASGTVSLWPIPSSPMPMDWDCICTPISLVDDTTAEAIPYPWTDCVPYFSAYLALMNSRRPEEAKNMFGLYEQFMKRARQFSESTFVPSYYD
jgi:hypothetical protein